MINKDDQKKGFTILGGGQKKHHHQPSTGVINLNQMSPVIVDVKGKKAYVDLGAMHARSAVERKVKFSANKDDVPNGQLYWLVWVQVEKNETGAYYAGVTGCEMIIDHETHRGYKNLPQHVNYMDKALKGQIIVDHMDDESKQLLGNFLKTFDQTMWENTSNELKHALSEM